jgi:ABC-2 type transport system permease protein
VAVLVLGKVYGIVWPQQAIASWNTQVNTTLIHNGNGLKDALMSDTNLWTWVAHDFAQTMGQLATLEFVGWTALAAAGFALVVAKRARGG